MFITFILQLERSCRREKKCIFPIERAIRSEIPTDFSFRQQTLIFFQLFQHSAAAMVSQLAKFELVNERIKITYAPHVSQHGSPLYDTLHSSVPVNTSFLHHFLNDSTAKCSYHIHGFSDVNWPSLRHSRHSSSLRPCPSQLAIVPQMTFRNTAWVRRNSRRGRSVHPATSDKSAKNY